MKDFETTIFRALKEHGVVNNGWKIKIINKQISSSDYAVFTVNVIRPRCRKACITWEICIWLPGMLVRWDKSWFHK